MTCPTPSESEIQALISQVNTLLANVTETQACDSECQKQRILDNLKTNLEESTDSYTSCEAKYKGDEKAYIVQKYGISYYNEQESKKKNDLLQSQKKMLIDSFMEKMAETNNNFDILQNDVNHLKLIQNMYANTGVNKSLNDIFGITISPFEGFRTLETLNQEITFSFKKNETGKFINMILYIIFYILALLIIIYMIVYKRFELHFIIPMGLFILVLPLFDIIKIIIYLFAILKSLF
jgi:hypothetical protein